MRRIKQATEQAAAYIFGFAKAGFWGYPGRQKWSAPGPIYFWNAFAGRKPIPGPDLKKCEAWILAGRAYRKELESMNFKTPELQEAWDQQNPSAFLGHAMDVCAPDYEFRGCEEPGMKIFWVDGVGLIQIEHYPVAEGKRMGKDPHTTPAITATWKLEKLTK